MRGMCAECRNWRNIFDKPIVESHGSSNNGLRSPQSKPMRQSDGAPAQASPGCAFFHPVNPAKTRLRDQNECVRWTWHTFNARTPSTAKTDARKNCAIRKRELESIDPIEASGE